ncbi:MAG: helix-turn-helix domain-containing protein [Oscillospiraceae bacterium]|nr:helix-turn-helix domain-containing protein [Oscillospiraceae bacterium]
METKDVILDIRKKNNLSQDEMAQQLFVTRQAVSRWETGETVPNAESLKLISKTYNVSVNTLLGSPRQLICQCCGMPLDDSTTSREPDGEFNEEYCKWCYTDGKLVYHSMQELMDFLVPHMSSMHGCTEQEMREMLEKQLPNLNLWKNG